MQVRTVWLADRNALAFDPGVCAKPFAAFADADAELRRYALSGQ